MRRRGREDLDDEIGSAFDPPVADEVPALGAHENDVGLEVVALAEQNVDRRGEDDPEGMFADELAQDPHQVRDDHLVGPGGGRRHRQLSVDDLVARAAPAREAGKLRVRPAHPRPIGLHGVPSCREARG